MANDSLVHLALVAAALLDGATERARTGASRLPLDTPSRVTRRSSPALLVEVARRDGFIDRYTGERLVFPGTLRAFSLLLPEKLPFHPNWAYGKCHPMYWELYPTLDHVVPIARGGADSVDNLVITSQRMNSAKAHWTLDELRWTLQPPGDGTWDGMTGWFLAITTARPELLNTKALRDWHRVLR